MKTTNKKEGVELNYYRCIICLATSRQSDISWPGVYIRNN